MRGSRIRDDQDDVTKFKTSDKLSCKKFIGTLSLVIRPSRYKGVTTLQFGENNFPALNQRYLIRRGNKLTDPPSFKRLGRLVEQGLYNQTMQ